MCHVPCRLVWTVVVVLLCSCVVCLFVVSPVGSRLAVFNIYIVHIQESVRAGAAGRYRQGREVGESGWGQFVIPFGGSLLSLSYQRVSAMYQ